MSRLTAIMRAKAAPVDDRARPGQAVAIHRDDDEAEDRRRGLGEETRPADAGNAEAIAAHEDDGDDNVDAVEDKLEEEAVAGAAEADQPAEDDVVGEDHRRGHDPDVPVGAGGGLHRGAAADTGAATRSRGAAPAGRGARDADAERQDQRAEEGRDDLVAGRRRRTPGRRGRSCRSAGN